MGATFVSRKLVYSGKGGKDDIFVYPSDDPITIEAVGLSSGETITFQHSNVPHPSTKFSSIETDFPHIDDHYDWKTAFWGKPNGKIYITDTNKFWHPYTNINKYGYDPQLFVYNKSEAEQIVQNVTIHADSSSPSFKNGTSLWGCKVRSAFGILGWRVSLNDVDATVFEIAQTNGVDHSLEQIWEGGTPADGDTIEFGFSATEAWLSQNGTEIWRGTLPNYVQGVGRMGIYQRSYGYEEGADPVNFMTLNSITPANTQWEDIPNLAITPDNPFLSIYSPILLRCIVPATTNYVSLIINRAT